VPNLYHTLLAALSVAQFSLENFRLIPSFDLLARIEIAGRFLPLLFRDGLGRPRPGTEIN
jgi:hypothetical protein